MKVHMSKKPPPFDQDFVDGPVAVWASRIRPADIKMTVEEEVQVTDLETRCPNCFHPIPATALAALNEKLARGEPAECDYCPY